MATSGSNGYELNWTLGGNTVLTLAEIGDKLQINGYKENDFVITKSESGNLVLTDAKHGTITISNWPSDNAPSIVFSAMDYTKEMTGEQINAQLFNVVTLSDDQSYSGGTDTHQEFDIAFSEATNITIESSSSTEDRIKFTKSTDENWSVDNVEMQIIGNDFYIKNWDKAASKVIDGQVVIRNYMNSSVKTIEFEEYTYHLVTGTESYVGSDTIRDRYLFLDSVKNGSDSGSGDWNVTIEGAGSGKGDILDFHYLPNNMHYYGLYSQRDGRDMVLSYQYSPTPGSNLKTLGTVRLKNYFNEDGSVKPECCDQEKYKDEPACKPDDEDPCKNEDGSIKPECCDRPEYENLPQCKKEPASTPELPNTGPGEIALAVVAAVCVITGVSYWYRSQKEVAEVQKGIKGDDHHGE